MSNIKLSFAILWAVLCVCDSCTQCKSLGTVDSTSLSIITAVQVYCVSHGVTLYLFHHH